MARQVSDFTAVIRNKPPNGSFCKPADSNFRFVRIICWKPSAADFSINVLSALMNRQQFPSVSEATYKRLRQGRHGGPTMLSRLFERKMSTNERVRARL